MQMNNNTIAQELETKTQAYWKISQAFNRGATDILIGEAITDCVDIIQTTNYTRPASYLTSKLLDELIEGQSLSKPQETQLLKFPDLAQAY